MTETTEAPKILDEGPDEPRLTLARRVFGTLGPGLVTGAADDDPSGIATYSQVGAQFGYSMGWTMTFAFPLMAAIQEISARIGATTGHGIATNLRKHYPRWLLDVLVLSLFVANTINLGADIAAMGDAAHLFIGGNIKLWMVGISVASLLAEVYLRYARYASILKWLTLSLFAYVAAVFLAGADWGAALSGAFIPRLAFNGASMTALVAVLGTTISPYLFFWQSSQEVEELERRHKKPLFIAPKSAGAELRRIRIDTLVGMFVSDLIALFIIWATAATLHAHGIRTIGSSVQAAQALAPIAGKFASVIFALGILGTGLLALPVLAGSASYAVCETFRWNTGLDRKPRQAMAFYGVIALAMLLGVGLAFTPIDPMKALYWSAVVNGVLAAPLMAIMLLIGSNPRVMRKLTLPPILKGIGWIATAVMAAAAIGLFVT
jgi:NRAMP (natural resistance-associated macrophage protein)-like metal ion transporter